jgi:hypothetical protein
MSRTVPFFQNFDVWFVRARGGGILSAFSAVAIDRYDRLLPLAVFHRQSATLHHDGAGSIPRLP